MTWTRHGECDRCGFCCRALMANRVTVTFGEDVVADPEFAAVRGIEIEGGVARKKLHILDACSKLDTGTELCTIYEERPRTCREFPTGPEAVVGIPCTYWFEDETGLAVGGLRSPHPAEVPDGD